MCSYKTVIYSLLIFVVTFSDARSFFKEDDWIPRLTEQDLSNYSLVTRIPLTTIYKYTFYRDVSILFYPMPEDVEEVQFTFIAHEEKMNILGGKCEPQDIDIHIKARGFPVVSPQNISFPEDYVDNKVRNHISSFLIKSDESNNSIILKNPIPGDWYGIAFVSWTDPNSDKIEQQGIAADCDTLLYADMRIKKAEVSIIKCDTKIELHLRNISTTQRDLYKFFLDTENGDYYLALKIVSVCDLCSRAIVRINARSIPDKKNQILECVIEVNNTASENYRLKFSPFPKEWHYMEIKYLFGKDQIDETATTEMCEKNDDIRETLQYSNDSNVGEKLQYDLVRDTKTEYFTFEYNLPPDVNEHTPTMINLTSEEIATMKFRVHPVQDIGGTLSLGTTLKLDFKYYMGYKREKNNASQYIFTEDDQFFKVVVCASEGKKHTPTINNTCVSNGEIQPATIVVNSTDSESVSGIVHFPYPETGVWYVTLMLFCDRESVCPCSTVSEGNVTKYLVNPDGNSVSRSGQRTGSEKCNTSVVFSVSSAPCMGGKCGRNGACNYYSSGGILFSSCKCRGGYAGWDCSDASNVIPGHEILMSTLFLTLSNLLFIPSIYFAIIRKYYTEAVVYFFTMFFSTFYHACDVSDANYSMCIVRMGVLQYSDFFCGLLSFWVTLVAMAALDNRTVSILHMAGAVMIAFGTELNKQAFLVFLVPVAVGVCIVGAAWGIRCRQTKKMFPARGYLIVYLPAGLLLAAVGLICFAFLQTNSNYHIVHSVWHMIIALSILCFLPNRATFFPKS